MLGELDMYVRKEVKHGDMQGHAHAAYAPSPISESYWDLRDQLETILYEVGASIAVYGCTSSAQYISHIQHRLDRLAVSHDCKHSYNQILSITLKIKQRLTPPSEMIIFGNCPNPLCGKELFGISDQTDVTCRYCGQQWHVADVKAVRLFHSLNSEQTATAHEIAVKLQSEGYNIKSNTIRQWAHRGRITPISETDNPPTYPLSDVYAIIKTKENSKCA